MNKGVPVKLVLGFIGLLLGLTSCAAHSENPTGGSESSASSSSQPSSAAPTPTPPPKPDLTDPSYKELALELVGTAENSTLEWSEQYDYIKDIGDGRGYTGGLIGFCSGTGDMYELVSYYNEIAPGNVLSKHLRKLRRLAKLYAKHNYEVNPESGSTKGLGKKFAKDWKKAAADPQFQEAQIHEVNRSYFNPAVELAKKDGLGALGQFAYFDAAINMGPVMYGEFKGMRKQALKSAELPSKGGSEDEFLNAFFDARLHRMSGDAYGPTDRVRVQRQFLNEGKFGLELPLEFTMYEGDDYKIATMPTPEEVLTKTS